MCVSCLFFFFFQAEDGIRDYKVTGVQTCALPIWWHFSGNLYSSRTESPEKCRRCYGIGNDQQRLSPLKSLRVRSQESNGVCLGAALSPGRRLCRLRAAPHEQPRGAGGAQPERDPLRGIERSAPQVALLVVAEELHHESHRAVEQQIQHDDGAAAMWFADAPVEQAEDRELREGFVKLGGMERDVERHAYDFSRHPAVERDRPRQVTQVGRA